MNLLLLLFLFQTQSKPVPPPVKPCTYEGKASSIDKNGKITTSRECFDDFVAVNSTLGHSGWIAIFSNDMKEVKVTDPGNQLECRALEIKDHQGFMYVCTTK